MLFEIFKIWTPLLAERTPSPNHVAAQGVQGRFRELAAVELEKTMPKTWEACPFHFGSRL